MNNGMPGVSNGRTATPRKVLVTDRNIAYVPGGVVIDGAKSRDPLNPDGSQYLRPGTVMGKITTSGKYAPSILGLSTEALADDATTLTVSTATAAEIVRRIGTSGTFKMAGPPTAAGVVATDDVAFSAVDLESGEITITATGTDFVSGSFILPDDGSEVPRCLIADNRDAYGIKVTDEGGNSIDVPFPQPVVGGFVDASQIVYYPADASLQQWLKDQLNVRGVFFFDDDF